MSHKYTVCLPKIVKAAAAKSASLSLNHDEFDGDFNDFYTRIKPKQTYAFC